MPNIEPVERGDRGVSVWVVVGFAAVVVAFLGFTAWFLLRNLTDEEAATGSEPVATPSTVTSATLPAKGFLL